ncbi:MAG: hypothetical protein HY535_04305 [Chloroflexi bacterium]|nr:hypothetical protein [Chloroflexota bacterium]
MLGRYMYLTGMVSFALIILFSLLLDLWALDLRFLMFVGVTTILLLLYARYAGRIHRLLRTGLMTLLVIYSVPVNALALAVPVYVIANFPPERPFQERLALSFGPKHEQEAYEEWKGLSASFSDTEQDRAKVLDFLEGHVLSMAEYDLKSSDPGIPGYVSLLSVFDKELEEVLRLARQGNQAEARQRYARLWRVCRNLVSGNGPVIQHLVGVAGIDRLVSSYLENTDHLSATVDQDVLNIAKDAMEDLDTSFSQAMNREYYWIRFVLRDASPADLAALGRAEKLPLDLLPTWPLLDKNKTLRKAHEYYELIVTPRGVSETMEQRLDAIQRKLAEASNVSFLHNPVGSIMLDLLLPSVHRFVARKDQSKARLVIFQYVAKSLDAGQFGPAPVDPLTGTPFLMADRGDSVEIRSEYVGTGGSAITYQVKKPLR